MFQRTLAQLEPRVAAGRPSRFVLIRRFLTAFGRSLRVPAEREAACQLAAVVFDVPIEPLRAAAAQGPEAADDALHSALQSRIERIPPGVEGIDRLVRWESLVAALVPSSPTGASPVATMYTLAPEMVALSFRLPELARSPLSAVIEGPAGSGRETLARAIHSLHRGARPFVSIDARALDPATAGSVLLGSGWGLGRVADAAEGTLCFRHPEALPWPVQARLARSLELGAWVDAEGRPGAPIGPRLLWLTEPGADWMPELQHRAMGLHLRVPPLTSRGEDLAGLASFVIRQHVFRQPDLAATDPRLVVAPRALVALYAYDWPGEITEFVTAMREARQRAGAGPVELWHLPDRVASSIRSDGDSPLARLRLVLLELAPATMSTVVDTGTVLYQLRSWLESEFAILLDGAAGDRFDQQISSFNAWASIPVSLDTGRAALRSALARVLLHPPGRPLPLWRAERASLVAEYEYQSQLIPLPAALVRAIETYGRQLALQPESAVIDLESLARRSGPSSPSRRRSGV